MGLLERLIHGGPRPTCKCGKKMLPLRRGVPVFVCPCGALKIGRKTVTLDGVANLIRWSASGTPAVLGEVGMNVANGRMRQFVGGASQEVANLADITAAGLDNAIFTDAVGGLFTTASAFPAYVPVPGATVSWVQAVTGGLVIFWVSCNLAPTAGFVNGTQVAFRFDGGVFTTLGGDSSLGLGIPYQNPFSGVFTFDAVAGAHTIDLGIAVTTAATGQINRSALYPLTMVVLHG